MPAATDWKEQIPDDEAARFERYATMFGEMQTRGGRRDRALHAKANLGVEAELQVLAEVSGDAKLGMFAEPKVYRAFARFSNGSPRHQPDKKPDVRGLASRCSASPARR
jgi:catalase